MALVDADRLKVKEGEIESLVCPSALCTSVHFSCELHSAITAADAPSYSWLAAGLHYNQQLELGSG